MRSWSFAVAVAGFAVVVSAVPAPGRAESFDELAARAQPVSGARAFAALYWSQVATCRDEDDFYRRQCESIKAARRERVTSSTFLLEVESGLEVHPLNEKALSVDVELRGCAACEAVDLAGEQRSIVGRGPVKVVGGKVVPASVHVGTRTFASATEGKAWVGKIAPRLTAELLLRVPATLEAWSQGAARGYHAEVVGFRVVDRCEGSVLWARPASADVAPDPRACGAK